MEPLPDDCPRCAGTGYALLHPPDIPFSQSLAELIECPDCDGTGKRRPVCTE
jgi:DnaJ-class molecular chaperone